jgi:hypothetical protein
MIEKRKASKRKVAKRGGNVTKVKLKSAPKAVPSRTKTPNPPPARIKITEGLPRSTAKKVPTKIATGVKRSMTFGDAYGLRKAINTGKMSNLDKEVKSMKSRRPNKVTTRYKK